MNFKVKSASLIVAMAMVLGTGDLLVNESNAQGTTYKIGDKGPAGGWVFYDKGNSDGGWRYLEAAPEDQGKAEWECHGTSIPGAKGTAIGTGKSNTEAIVKGCREANRSAKLCAAYRGGGKSDWFLPSLDELKSMYTNLYKKGVGGFADRSYWSSSESFTGRTTAWALGFYNGGQSSTSKHSALYVRAVRAF